MRRAMTCVSWEPKSRTAMICAMRSYGGLAARESIPIPDRIHAVRILLLRLLVRPLLHVRLEHAQREGTLHEKGVVKSPDVEFVPELLLGGGANGEDLQLADLVAQRLTRCGHVAFDLGHVGGRLAALVL